MIRYIIVDDSPKTLVNVKRKIDTISKDYHLHCVGSYDSSIKAFENALKVDFDLLIVDFKMPVYNGIELALKIAKNKKIIFLTSTSNNEQLIINSLDISGFLSKPFDITEFQKILKNKIIGKTNPEISQNTNPITLQTSGNKDVIFTTEKIYYISTSRNFKGEQPDKNYVHFYGKNDELLFKNIRKSIKALNKELAEYNFNKINQSTIINMKYLKERDNTHISLYDCKETFNIAQKEKTGFIARLRGK